MANRVQYLSTDNYYTVIDALLDLAIKLPMERFGGSMTKVSSTQFTDTNLNAENGVYQYGTLFIFYVSSEVNYKYTYRVTEQTTSTVTFSPACDNYSTGSLYYMFSYTFPRWLLIQSLDLALRDIGDIPIVRNITTDGGQEYNYNDSEVILTGNEVVKIELGANTSAPYDYYPHYHWQLRHDAYNGHTILFEPGHVPDSGYPMKITYMAAHKPLDGSENYAAPTWAAQDALEIGPAINPERLSWQAAVYALRWKVHQAPEKALYAQALQEAMQRAEQQRARHPIRKPTRIKLSNYLVGWS